MVYCYSSEGVSLKTKSRGKLLRWHRQSDKLQSRQVKHPNKRKKKLLQQHRVRLEERISNRVKDMHYKTIKHLMKYKTISLPLYESSKMKCGRKVNRANRRLSHYRFRQRLISKAELCGTKVFVCAEPYTTKTCGNCLNQRRMGGSERVYSCRQCRLKLPRDQNSARLIKLQNHILGSVEPVIHRTAAAAG